MRGAELKRARLEAGYSLRKLAEHIDVPEQTIRRVERDLGVTPANAKKIADFFEIKVTDLAAFEDIAA